MRFPQGQGRLVGAQLAELPIPKALAAALNGTLDPVAATKQAQADLETIAKAVNQGAGSRAITNRAPAQSNPAPARGPYLVRSPPAGRASWPGPGAAVATPASGSSRAWPRWRPGPGLEGPQDDDLVFQLGQPDDQVGQRQQVLELLWRSTGGQQIARGYSVSSPTRRSSESPTRVGAASQASSAAACAASNGTADPDQRVLSDQDLEQSVEEGKQRDQASARR